MPKCPECDQEIGSNPAYKHDCHPVDVLSKLHDLREWKESAMNEMQDMQEIGRAIGVPLGAAIGPAILPAILSMKEELERLKAPAVVDIPPSHYGFDFTIYDPVGNVFNAKHTLGKWKVDIDLSDLLTSTAMEVARQLVVASKRGSSA